MTDWINAIVFGVALIAFTLGLSSIVMGFMTAETGAKGMQEKKSSMVSSVCLG